MLTEETVFDENRPNGDTGVPVASAEYSWTKKFTLAYVADH